MSSTHPVSARVPQEDFDFITKLDVAGAKTPSDKVRHIIAEARKRYEGVQDYHGCLLMIQELIRPAMERINQGELDLHTRSEVVHRILAWMPETIAYAVSISIKLADGSDEAKLKELEAGLADRIFTLMQSILQMGVTPKCSCYNGSTIADRVEPVIDLVGVINATRS